MLLSELLNLVLCSQKVLGALCDLDNVLQSSRVKIKTLAGPTHPEVPKSHSFPLYHRNLGWLGLKGHLIPPSCCGQGHVQLDQVAQSLSNLTVSRMGHPPPLWVAGASASPPSL